MKRTSAEICQALRRRFCAPEAEIAFEVAQGTGALAHRHLDAVAMEVWPSRGLALHGIEIKVDLYDWRREKANPAKAEQIARFCDFFWIAAPASVVPVDELPTAWGLMEMQSDGRLINTKQAVRTDAEPIGRPFLAAMLRARGRGVSADEADVMITERRKALEADFDARLKREVEFRTQRNAEDGERWRQLIEKLGEEPDRLWVDNAEVVAAINAVRKAGVTSAWQGLRSVIETLDGAAKKLREAGVLLDIDTAAKSKRRKAA